MPQVFCLENIDPDEGHLTGHHVEWPLEAECQGYVSDGFAVQNCLFSTQLFDSELMEDDGQEMLLDGHIIMLTRWSYVDTFRYDSLEADDNLQPPHTQ